MAVRLLLFAKLQKLLDTVYYNSGENYNKNILYFNTATVRLTVEIQRSQYKVV